MRSAKLWIVLASLLGSSVAFADPCEGKGTKLFFVNGIRNDWRKARKNLSELKAGTQAPLSAIAKLEYELAFVEGRGSIIDVVEAAVQRGVDDFSRFWLWMEGIEAAPDCSEGPGFLRACHRPDSTLEAGRDSGHSRERKEPGSRPGRVLS